jgi:hypothetical protein
MVGDPFLLAMGGIVGAVEVEHDVVRRAIPLSLLQVELHQRAGQPVAGFGIHGVLQPGEGGLAGQIGLMGETTTDQLQERIAAQGISIVLVVLFSFFVTPT